MKNLKNGEENKGSILIMIKKDRAHPLYVKNYSIICFDIQKRKFIKNPEIEEIINYKIYSFDNKEDNSFLNFYLSKNKIKKRVRVLDAYSISPSVLFHSIEVKLQKARPEAGPEICKVKGLPNIRPDKVFFQPKNLFNAEVPTTNIPDHVVKLLENNNFKFIEDNKTSSIIIDSCRYFEGKSKGKAIKRIFINTPEGSLYYDLINGGFYVDNKNPLGYSPDMRIVERKVLDFLGVRKEELPLWRGEKYREGYVRKKRIAN